VALIPPLARAARARVPRALHPVAWWVWAIGMVTAVSRTSDPLLLVLALAVLAFVIASRRSDAPWARAFKYYLIMAAVVIVVRVVFRSIFTSSAGPAGHVLFRLPHIALPHWYSGVHLGGPVSLEATLAASFDGLRLGTLLCCVGAANVLANPKRALRVLPGALYELGVAVIVALSVAPQLVESAQRVNRARRLRGAGQHRGLGRIRALRAIAIPVLEDALDRSLRLAAGMDSRGYGRAGRATAASRRITAVLLLVGMCGLCVGVYGLLGGSSSRVLGVPAIGAGAVLCAAGLLLGSRRVRRTAYRPDPWRAPEWTVAGGGVACAVLMYASSAYDSTTAAALNPTLDPLRWPTLPVVPTLGILLAGLAALAAPPPVRRRPPRIEAPTPVAAPAERESVPA
jgi:energy-coupling factor transport system permease protein